MTTRFRAWLQTFGKDLNEWLGSVPTTPFMTLVGASLAVLTFALYATLALLEKPVEEIAFGLWLGFVAAWAGLDFKRFKAKRETQWQPPDKSAESSPEPPKP